VAKAVEAGRADPAAHFGSGRDYRGGNAMFLTMQSLDRGYADPRWGGYRQIQEAGGHVRKGEKGTPILYVEWRQHPHGTRRAGQPGARREWAEQDGVGRAGPAPGQGPARLQRRADRGPQAAVARRGDAGVGRGTSAPKP